MSFIKNEDRKIVDVIKKMMPAVVSITVSKKETNNLNLPPFQNTKSEKFVSGGSGFIVRDNGIILTNRHVIEDPHNEHEVTLGSGEKYNAELIARDPLDDLAILKIDPEGKKLPIVPLGSSENLNLGERVLALGNVLGLFEDTVSAGIVSGLSRSITARIDKHSQPSEMRGLVQTDAAINPGNSGGPLVNLKSEAIGINVAMIAGLENVGFALPIDIVTRDLDELKNHGRIRRPFLGVRYLTLNEEISKKLNLPVNRGALVIRGHSFENAVVEESPADKAGIKEKDVILEWDGDEITQKKNIQDYLSDCEVGDKVTVKIFRDGEEFETDLTLVERR